jgi:hypothetical protein
VTFKHGALTRSDNKQSNLSSNVNLNKHNYKYHLR